MVGANQSWCEPCPAGDFGRDGVHCVHCPAGKEPSGYNADTRETGTNDSTVLHLPGVAATGCSSCMLRGRTYAAYGAENCSVRCAETTILTVCSSP